MAITHEQVLEALKYVEDPDLKKDLVTLGMIKDVKIVEKKVSFTVVLTTPACPMKEMIHKACVNAIIHFVDSEAEVEVTMTSNVTTTRQDTKELLPGVKNIIAVASGKGGVGKSTVAVNLAVALAKNGAKVGFIDADIYGPSAPIMFGVENERLFVSEVNGESKIIPVEKYGVKLLSIGFMADPAKAIVWRGPMASKALRQLFSDANWGELDYMIVDLPPGTGDIHLTLVSAVPVTGALIVSTPQKVAVADVRKGVEMFRLDSVRVPVLGVVENMAYFIPEDAPEKKYYIFGETACKEMALKLEIPYLGELPMTQAVSQGGDSGMPIALHENSEVAKAFNQLAEKVAQQIAIRNATMAPTQTIEAIH